MSGVPKFPLTLHLLSHFAMSQLLSDAREREREREKKKQKEQEQEQEPTQARGRERKREGSAMLARRGVGAVVRKT